MTDPRTFDPGISGSVAVLPDAPALWSYSSLKAVETCPRRYVLSRATYTDLRDRSGIVHQVTAILSQVGANIEDFDTHVSVEPHSGAPLFHMDARLRLPPTLSAQGVQAALEEISAEIMVDISLSPADVN